MSSNPRSLRLGKVVLVVAVATASIHSSHCRALEIEETALAFAADASSGGFVTVVGGAGIVATGRQIVLEWLLVTPVSLSDDDVLLGLEVLCRSGDDEVSMLQLLDLFSVKEYGEHREILFDLSPLAMLDSLPCPGDSLLLRLAPQEESVVLTVDVEAPNANLQIVQF